MPKISDSRTVSLPREKIYALMMDIEKYPSFIPFIRAARFTKRGEKESHARLRLGVAGIGFSYTCKIVETPYDEILIHAIEGPFEHLRARLTFEDAGKGKTRIGYEFESRFRSRRMNAVVDPIFNTLLKNTLRDVERYILRELL